MRILLLNPNTSAAMTARMAQASQAALAPDVQITALTATTGLPYIASRAEAQLAGAAVLETLAAHHAGHDAAVIAAYGDPGLIAARELFDLPVVGMAEAAMLTACQLGSRFAIVTFSPALLPWYEDAVALAGLSARCVGLYAVRRPFQVVTEVQDELRPEILARAERAVADGADTVILAGAPLAGLATALCDAVPVPLIDPLASALGQAQALVRLGTRPPTSGRFARPPAKPATGLTGPLARWIARREEKHDLDQSDGRYGSALDTLGGGPVPPLRRRDGEPRRGRAILPGARRDRQSDPQRTHCRRRRRGGAGSCGERGTLAIGRTAEPLDGVPVTIKDSLNVAGFETCWGSRLYAGRRADEDETPVRRLRAAGAVILAKTNVPELTVQGYTGNPVFGVTCNPWDPALTPGGSSGGAVAAVSAGIGPLAIGTDAGGSIRRPASHTGLVGLKPTAGRVPRRGGLPPIMLDLEVVGPMARTVDDLAAAMRILGAADADAVPQTGFGPFGSAAVPERPLRILYVPAFGAAPVEPEIADSVAEAAGRLFNLGHRVETGRFDAATAITEAWPILGQAGIAWLMRTHPDRLDALGPDIRVIAEAGAKLSASDLFDVQRMALALRQDLAALFAGHDLLMTPTAAALPWSAQETHPDRIAGVPVGPRGSATFTGFVNASGCPGISIPCRPSGAGLPIGFQLVAPWGGDETLVSVAATYEAAHPWPMLWEGTKA